jgi:hypothetical protein
MMHDLLVHEIGAPIMLTGNRLGNPRMAGTATHVQRYWQDRDTTGRLVPYSFAMLPEGASSSLNLAAASAVGQHPGSARPLTISTSVNTVIGDLVGRKYLGSDVTRVDQLLDYYSARNTGRYVDGAGVPLRSRGVADHEFAISSLINAPNLEEVLTPNLFNAPSRATCGVNNNADVSAMTIEAACALLTHPTTPAKMVHVVDGGTTTFGTLTYDLHSQLVENGTLNMRHALGTLMGQINEEGEGDPTKLDIEDTLIVLNAEFGRAPVPQGGDVPGGGSDHFPWGFVSVIIGGPVQQGVTGAIGPDGYAVEYVTPTEFRAAILAALGIYPFSAQSYAVGDIRDVENEADGLAWLNEIVLGRS